jgi:8-oxo-dGTP pyrophosphatase MutT (NUDIX family)
VATPSRWNVRREAHHADCKVFEVLRRTCHHPLDSREGDFFVIRCPDWVLALPVTADGRIVMVRQWRFGAEALSLEPPGGVRDGEEDPLATAARETREETGYGHGRPLALGSVSPNPALQSNRCHFVLLEGVRNGQPRALDEHEEIEVLELAPAEALARVRAGETTHALAELALLRLREARPSLFA